MNAIPKEVDSTINMFYEVPRCFTKEEMLACVDTEVEAVTSVLLAIDKDPRFISIDSQLSEQKLLLSKKSLHKWYVNLNMQLAKAKTFRLDRNKVASMYNSLRIDRSWDTPPIELVEFGRKYWFISATDTLNEYCFPLAYIMSFINSGDVKRSEQSLIYSYENSIVQHTEHDLSLGIRNMFEGLPEREEFVITRRHGLLGCERMTLESIGKELHVTRERIRQIEKGCLKRLSPRSSSKFLVSPFLFYLMHKNGGLVVHPDEPRHEIQFVARCLNVPLSQFPYTDLFVLGLKGEELNMPEEMLIDELTIETLDDLVRSTCEIPLTYDDLTIIAQSIKQKPVKHVTKAERVYQVLKQMGKPSHYSYVTEAYNEVFPDDISSERSIHGILGREEHGIVWIGIKGTYALKEWGFEHPAATLFDTIAEIVEQKYQETGNPVSFTVIFAEISKHRKLFNRNSILMASYFNPRLKNVDKDYFIPSKYKKDIAIEKIDIAPEELDKVLQHFEIRIKGGGKKMAEQMSYEKALEIAKTALEAFKQAKTKADVQEIFIKYGRNGIGYRPLCKMFFSQRTPEVAVQAYKKSNSE